MTTTANKQCRECGVALQRQAGDDHCWLCRAYAAGQMILREGMCFYVTAARVRELPNWLAGEWVMSRIVETHATLLAARDAVRCNNKEAGQGAEHGSFYFVASNQELVS